MVAQAHIAQVLDGVCLHVCAHVCVSQWWAVFVHILAETAEAAQQGSEFMLLDNII